MSDFNKSIEQLVADIKSQVEEWHAAAAAHSATVRLHTLAVTESEKARDFFVAEYMRAKAIAEKPEALVKS